MGLAFLSIAVGSVLGSCTVILIDRLVYQKRYAKLLGGQVAPEQRLYAAMVGSLGLPVGLFWFAWTAKEEVHWISSVIAAVFIVWGNLCVFVSRICDFLLKGWID